MALYILIVEGYTDCALIEAILERNMGFCLYKNKNDMPILFQSLVKSYPSVTGNLNRTDMPHFYYCKDVNIIVKVAGGESNFSKNVEEVLQAADLSGTEKEINKFILFTDSDCKNKWEIENLLKKRYEEREIYYKIQEKKIAFLGREYEHELYVYPNQGFGAVEKVLLAMTEKVYPELSDMSKEVRRKLFEKEFAEFRKSNWASEAKIQEFYGDKFQFGVITSALKPDRPVGFAIKDKIVKKEFLKELENVDEFCRLRHFLNDNILEIDNYK